MAALFGVILIGAGLWAGYALLTNLDGDRDYAGIAIMATIAIVCIAAGVGAIQAA